MRRLRVIAMSIAAVCIVLSNARAAPPAGKPESSGPPKLDLKLSMIQANNSELAVKTRDALRYHYLNRRSGVHSYPSGISRAPDPFSHGGSFYDITWGAVSIPDMLRCGFRIDERVLTRESQKSAEPGPAFSPPLAKLFANLKLSPNKAGSKLTPDNMSRLSRLLTERVDRIKRGTASLYEQLQISQREATAAEMVTSNWGSIALDLSRLAGHMRANNIGSITLDQ